MHLQNPESQDVQKLPGAPPRAAAALPVFPSGDQWRHVATLPTILTFAVPIPCFRVRDALALKPGMVVASAWAGGKDVPLFAGEIHLAYADLETAEEALGARITRIL